MKFKRHYLFFVLLLHSVVTKAQNQRNFTAIISEFENKLNTELINDHSGASISYAVLKKDTVVYANAVGYADFSKNKKADTNTLYRIGSMTKPITALLMMLLVQDKSIMLTDPVERYLPEIANLKGYNTFNKITFIQLASHTSGLNREPDTKKSTSGAFEEWEKKALGAIQKTKIRNNPEQKFKYSNIGYGILGLALSRAAGKPYTKLVNEKIFQPLGMNQSYFQITDETKSNLAQGMKLKLQKESRNAAKEHGGRGYKVPSGGIYSTPLDMIKFLKCISGFSAIIKQEHIDIMKISHASNEDYGLGLFIYKDDMLSVVCHDGLVDGYSGCFVLDQNSKIGIVILRNCSKGKTNMYNTAFDLLRKIIKSDPN
ncbi:MAG TPA: serine hydrolase domain-containing protein [Flavobacteriales bacterium]|nr:serine hydrolase domain-containing protein [Flavobacteriales bacterium]HRE96455.1 serine hydrolase domain-containing protein [Flavobacteriales bacterium]HRJ40093.1 serine hydrolase domain-containing protein [Flavobacteriales bacterium]